ncbi:MAG: hypothetical protein QNJ61_03165 [Desulfobacterales bacterium]|nr:hypothetical protein [Desulfobacterales bacterium]
MPAKLGTAENRAASGQNLFCYGTLQIPVVIVAVLGRCFMQRFVVDRRDIFRPPNGTV